MLTTRTALSRSIAFVITGALCPPFGNESFDVVWTQHCSMNIVDKDRLYAENHRVPRSGGRLALYEFMTGRRVSARFPVPWTTDQALSFLRPPAAVRNPLRAVGFAELLWEDVTESTLAALTAPAPPAAVPVASSSLGLHLLPGDARDSKRRNLVSNLAEERIALLRGVFER